VAANRRSPAAPALATATSAAPRPPIEKQSIILSGVAEITSQLVDSLYATTGGDIELNMCDDVAFIEFDRKPKSIQDAVKSAITQVEGANAGVRVVRVESDVANT